MVAPLHLLRDDDGVLDRKAATAILRVACRVEPALGAEGLAEGCYFIMIIRRDVTGITGARQAGRIRVHPRAYFLTELLKLRRKADLKIHDRASVSESRAWANTSITIRPQSAAVNYVR